MPSPLTQIDRPSEKLLGDSVEEFLNALPGPVCFIIPGKDQDRCRALSTLIHGNEPSGIRALYHYLLSGEVPAVNVLCFISSVTAARISPRFTHRHLPSGRDLNRCFAPPYDNPEGKLARSILKRLESAQPEALIDLHNTSAKGPPLAMATFLDERHYALASLFTSSLVHNDLFLNALDEVAGKTIPTILVECGGAADPEADLIAYAGVRRYMQREDLFGGNPIQNVELIVRQLRLEVVGDVSVVYSAEPQPGIDLTLLPNIDKYNYRNIQPRDQLGWTGKRGLDIFRIRGAEDTLPAEDYLMIDNDRLLCKSKLRVFMTTLKPDVVQSDCLFYFVSVPQAN